MKFRDHLSEQDYLDGDIGGHTQKIGYELANTNQFITIADKDHEIFAYHKKKEIWVEGGDNIIWNYCAKKYPALSKSMLNEIIHFIQGQTLLPRNEFSPPKGWLAFKNQCLDATHNYSDEWSAPDLYFRNRFPVRYDKKAVCPEFSKFLNQVLPDFEDKMTLLEAMALPLIPQFNFEKAAMFIGTSSANGKSTIMKVMRKLYGNENTVAISLQELIYNRFKAQKLDGALVNIYADINDKKITDLDQFKLFVSGDYVTVERKNGHPYEIVPKTKHYFSTNTLPEIDEDNTAVYRRFIIIEFPISFEDRKDLDLLDRITTTEELEGIMWLLIRIAKRMARKRDFTYPQSPDEIRMRWKQQSNAVYELIEKSNLISKKSDSRISREAFYTRYVRFCKSKHYTIKTPNTVTRQVEKLGYQTQKSNGVRYWLGIDTPKISDKDQESLS